MTRKKSTTTPPKSIKPKTVIKRRQRFKDIEDDYDKEHLEDTQYYHPGVTNEDSIDEFEHLQQLPDLPSILKFEEDITEEDESDTHTEPVKKTNHNLIDTNLTARGNKNKHYVKPEEFEDLIKKYYKHGVLEEDLCSCVFKIANRLSYRPNFVNYTLREEMVGDAIERMIFALSNRVYKYNPKKIGKNGKKGNAFLYFTKIAENAFINRIKIESRNRQTIDNYQEDVYHNLLQQGIDIGDTSKGYTE